MSTTATAHTEKPELRLTIEDLRSATGVFESYDSLILALCDTSFITEDIVTGEERFCHQIRSTTNADTVYLCSRNRLEVTATTSASNDVHNEDTQAIHQAILSMVADLGQCCRAVQIPSLSVFPEHAKLAVAIVPLSQQTLLVIVDPDEPYREINSYCADAMQAIYRCQTAHEHEGFAPTTRQLQCSVIDALNRQYSPGSATLAEKRYDMFMDDLSVLDINFEKLIEPQPTGNPTQWGWQAVPAGTHNLEQLFRTAKEWTTTFQTQLDLHILQRTSYVYKAMCEKAGLQRFSDIKPICISVSLQTLQQPAYIQALTELIEKSVLAGSHIVFEITESQTQNTHASIADIVSLLSLLRNDFGIKVLLSDIVLRSASLTTLLALEPDYIRVEHFISKAGTQPVGALIDGFSLLAETGSAQTGNAHPVINFPTDTTVGEQPDGVSSPRETEREAVPY